MAVKGEEKGEDEQKKDQKDQKPPQGKLLIEKASILNEKFFKNQSFLDEVASKCSQQVLYMDKFKKLAFQLLDEAINKDFNPNKTKNLMEELAAQFTDGIGMTTFEFQNSGLLQAIEIFLTKSASQA